MTEAKAPTARLGTPAVFFTALSTILGAIMFLRFGYAVAHVGLVGAFAIILLGHAVTLPTAMAIAEIATNQRVEGGGEYFIISRSFGLVIGASIGLALYLSQAVSVAFYVVAFGEAFDPLYALLQDRFDLVLVSKRWVTIPALVGLTALMLTRGAALGVRALYAVVVLLIASLVAFFLGEPLAGRPEGAAVFAATVSDPDPFFLVFAIVFPAFTGMTAGVGLSGDLKDPRRALPPP